MQRIAIYPGSFDPITNGHLDVIRRAAALFDKVVVAIAHNADKTTGLFTPEERARLIRAALDGEPQVEVDLFSGLLVDYVRQRGAHIIVRGLRAVVDFEYEFRFALMNRRLSPGVDTVFLMTDERNLYISSSLVKEVASLGASVADFVPEVVRAALERKLGTACTGTAAAVTTRRRPRKGHRPSR
jgi:pantetheine-phosphate adenylyltransferase